MRRTDPVRSRTATNPLPRARPGAEPTTHETIACCPRQRRDEGSVVGPRECPISYSRTRHIRPGDDQHTPLPRVISTPARRIAPPPSCRAATATEHSTRAHPERVDHVGRRHANGTPLRRDPPSREERGDRAGSGGQSERYAVAKLDHQLAFEPYRARQTGPPVPPGSSKPPIPTSATPCDDVRPQIRRSTAPAAPAPPEQPATALNPLSSRRRSAPPAVRAAGRVRADPSLRGMPAQANPTWVNARGPGPARRPG